MYSPKLNETEQTRDNIEIFGGYNGNVRISENEFSAMKNMSSVNYPALSPRPRRGRWTQLDGCQGVISKSEIGYVENDILKYGAEEMPLNSDCAGKERQLVSMGARIIVYPDYMYFNTADPSDCGNMYNEKKTFTATKISLCNADGIEYTTDEVHIDSYMNDGTFIPKNDAIYYIDPFEEVQYLQGLRSGDNSSTTATLTCKAWGIQNGHPIIELGVDSEGVYITTPGSFDKDQLRVELNAQRPIFGEIEYEGVKLHIVGVTNIAPNTSAEWEFVQNLNPIVVGDKRIVYEGGESKLQECVSVLPEGTWKSSECWKDVESYVKIKHSTSLKEYAEEIIESKASDRIVFEKTTSAALQSLVKRYSDKSPYIFRQQYAKAYENDSFLVRGCLDRTVSTANAVIAFVPKKPVLDFIIESGNRLWGCRYGKNEAGEYVNEIYATARGSFEWEIFDGTADDSYAVSLGTDGDFTGAINYKGIPIFFKENSYSAVYGAYPQSYTVDTEIGRGVQAGAHKTLCIIDNVLYYKSDDGIYRYDGASHDKISEALGAKEYVGESAGSVDGKYYISMTAENSISEVFVYDIRKDMWHKEDNVSVKYFVAHKGELYAFYESLVDLATETRFWAIKGTQGILEDSLPWSVDSGIIGYSTVDAKYVDKLQMRMMLPCGSRVSFYIEYDSDGYFEHIGSIDGKSFSAFTLPITPRRCDHFKLRITGEGECKIFSLSKVMELGGDL